MFELFKNRVVNSEGDHSKSLSTIATYKNGLAMQKFKPEQGEESLPVLKIRELNQGFTDFSSDRCSSNIDQSVIINTGDIIFSWSGTLLVKLWSGQTSGLNQHLFKVTSERYPSWFIYEWTKYYLKKFQEIAKDKATTMGHIKRSDLEASHVVIPNNLHSLNKLFTPLYNKKLEIIRENQKLNRLKTVLLNKYF